MIDELRALAIFAKVVEAGSFRTAANILKLSPSVVSHHVAQLEERVGVALLYRSTRRLSLTYEGEKLFISAEAMLSAAEKGFNSVAYHATEPTGKLNLTVPAMLTRSRTKISSRIRRPPPPRGRFRWPPTPPAPG